MFVISDFCLSELDIYSKGSYGPLVALLSCGHPRLSIGLLPTCDQRGHATEDAPEIYAQPGCWRCCQLSYIHRLRIDIPTFEVSEAASRLGFALNVTGGSCTGLHVADLLLSQASADARGAQLQIQTDLDIACSLNMDIEVLLNRPCTVDFVTTASAATLTLEVSSLNGLPGHSLVGCKLTPEVTQLQFKGTSLVCDTLRLTEGSIQTLVNDFASKVVCQKIEAALGSSLGEAADHMQKAVQPYLLPSAGLPAPETSEKVMDLKSHLWDGPLGHVARSFMEDVGQVSNDIQLNAVLAFIMRDLSLAAADGSMSLPVAGLGMEVNVTGVQNMLLNVTLQAASLGELATLEAVGIGFPGKQSIRSQGGFSPSGQLNATAEIRLRNGFAEVTLEGYTARITEKSPLAAMRLLSGAGVHLWGALTVFAAVDSEGLQGLQLDQMQLPSCSSLLLPGAPAAPAAGLLELRCRPQLRYLQAQLPDLGPYDLETQVLDTGLGIARALGKAFGQQAVQVIDGLLSSTGRDEANAWVVNFLSKPSACPVSNFSAGEIQSVDTPARWSTAVLLSLSLLLLLGAFTCARAQPSRPQGCPDQLDCSDQRGTGLLGVSAGAGDQNLQGTPSCQEERSPERGLRSPELAPPKKAGLGWSPGISPYLRWGVISAILGNIALFIVASVTPGVLISGFFEADNGSYQTPDISRLSMDNSLAQMLEVGSYFVWFAMVLFSLVWPYVKLLLMLHVWIAPVSTKTRGPLLMFLDQVGKWSLTDNFILFLFVSA
ncbi:unnamed protein product, partial [Polarella glacialis]